ncbi:hypothetical protein AB1Y20_022242 [Prymnesium parvum]|uniref:L-ascorbate peroxidase n=1 Tax=Prymnesium parvum TaxID=97485 RepID=A0AB34JIT1_PRYPA
MACRFDAPALICAWQSLRQASVAWDESLHLTCMCIAWLFCAPLALTVARLRHFQYFRAMLTRSRYKGGKQYWYLIHRNCLFAAVFLTILGGLVMLLTSIALFQRAHSYFGVATMSVATIQMLNGLFRPDKGRRGRVLWEKSHRALGVTIVVLAIISGCLGAQVFSYRLGRDYPLNSETNEPLSSFSRHSPPPPAISPPPPKILPPPPKNLSPPPPTPPAPVLVSLPTAASILPNSCRCDFRSPTWLRLLIVGPSFIRLAWNDAATFDATTGKYGPRASMRFAPEASYPSNKGLERARDLLEPIKEAVPSISYADLWQLAAVVSIELMGGPRVPFRAGRVDAAGSADTAPQGMLPGAHDTVEQLRAVFSRMGFNDRDLVTLLGAHTVGLCRARNSGFRGPWDSKAFRFNNGYYRRLLNTSWWEYDGSQYNFISGDGSMMLETDMHLAVQPVFSVWTRLFARNELLWFSSFSTAFQRLAELGHSPANLVSVDYTFKALHSGQLQPAVEAAAVLIQAVVSSRHVGPAFVRLAWQDAGTYNKTDGTYGPRAAMRFAPESSNPSNKGLQHARALLEPIKQAVPSLSYADLWQLAAVVSIEMMGGPKVPFRAGRVDAVESEESAPEGMLPGAHSTAQELRAVFSRMGFNDREIVALAGAHTLGRCHPQYSGFNGPWTTDPLSFDNRYFKDLMDKQWASIDNTVFGSSVQDGTLMLSSDMQLATDAGFGVWTNAFAHDQALFFSSFAAAFQKLGELGSSRLQDTTYTLSPISAAQTQPESDFVCLLSNGGTCVVGLQWEFHHEDDSVSIRAQVAGDVGWLSLGVSEAGRMIYPRPSYVVVGDASGVRKHMLKTQDVASQGNTAPLDPVQNLREASFERTNGFSTLRFRTDLEWFSRYMHPTTGSLHFIYAHGAFGDVSSSLGYHANNRGNRQLSAFGPRRFVVTEEVRAQVQLATNMVASLVRKVHAGPALVRLAWQDAGTYNKTDGTYGPRAAMRFAPESSNPSNKGLQHARALLEPIKQAVPSLSYADLWQLAAVVSIEMMGGPKVPFRAGRVDAVESEESAPEGMLPGAHSTAQELRAVFSRMGFNDREIVALAGAHTLGRCHPQYSGFNGPWTTDPLSFDNQYYVTMLKSNYSYNGSQWNTENGTMMLNADLNLLRDAQFLVYARLYALEEEVFFNDFASAFSKLAELGWKRLAPVSYLIPDTDDTLVVTTTANEVQLKTGMYLKLQLGQDGNVTATLTLNAIVGWMALGVSQAGRMVSPMPSHAVVGTNQGVQRRRLVAQEPDVARSAPMEADQYVEQASFNRVDGTSRLQFRAPLSWFNKFAAQPSSGIRLIYAHAAPGDASYPFAYHGLHRGNARILGLGHALPPRAAPASPPPAPPLAQTRSITPRANMQLSWTHNEDSTTTMTLRLAEHVQWLALAASATGRMILPEPSRAVVGVIGRGVYKRTLKAQDVTSVPSSAPLDAVQDLTAASVAHDNGATVLKFTVAQSFLTQFSNGGSNVDFIYSHGEPNLPTSTFGYHGLQRRGHIPIADFVAGSSGFTPVASPPPPSPPWQPNALVPIELTPRAGVYLSMFGGNWSTIAVELVVQQQVPWLSVAVSQSGWMTDPTPSKAIVGDLSSSSLHVYDLVYQDPSSPARSIQSDTSTLALEKTSVVYRDGVTALRFHVASSWLSSASDEADDDDTIWLLWAHGSPTWPLAFPSYHIGNRGAVSISRLELLGPKSPSPPPVPKPHSPPKPPPSGGSGGGTGGSDGCSGSGQITDYCGETLSYQVARCYMSTSSLTLPQFDNAVDAYENVLQLSTEFRVAWTVKGTYPSGEISILMQARTLGWLGFGLMSDTTAGGVASGNGMINTDIWIGNVVDGVATVLDTWSPSVAAPLQDAQSGDHSNDVYDVGGTEDDTAGLTTVWFTRKLVTNDTWDYKISPGTELPVIFAYSRKNVDSFLHYHGPTRGFDHVIFIPIPPPSDLTFVPIVLSVLLVLLIVGWMLDRTRRRQVARMEAARIDVLRQQVKASVESAGSLAFGMVLVNARDFLRHQRFIPHESLRDASELKVLDTISMAREFSRDQTIIFFSHQWLSWDLPDPERVHYTCMANVVKNLAKKQALENLSASWVWVDYSCMPQLNPTTLSLAVSDLSEVAALATYFVVIAPPAVHLDTQQLCDMETYQRRGWCRLEQFSYVCTGKTDSMLISTGGETETFAPYISQPAQWKQQALEVLLGEYTCCQRSDNHTVGDKPCDKDKLKPALLRMYMKAICHLPPCPLRKQLIERDRQIFPAHDFEDDILKLAREKFNEMAISVNEDNTSKAWRNWKSASTIVSASGRMAAVKRSRSRICLTRQSHSNLSSASCIQEEEPGRSNSFCSEITTDLITQQTPISAYKAFYGSELSRLAHAVPESGNEE